MTAVTGHMPRWIAVFWPTRPDSLLNVCRTKRSFAFGRIARPIDYPVDAEFSIVQDFAR
jgi:hypothetical protein